jgi:hypothetical protein
MVVQMDYLWSQGDAGTLVIDMVPPTPVGGESFQFNFSHRFGGLSGWAFKYVSSGYNGQSGISIVDSGAGRFQVQITPTDTSGLAFGAYSFSFKRTDSGAQTNLAEGFELLGP